MKIIICGDTLPNNKNNKFFNEGKINQCFDDKIKDLISASDYAVCNLEGPLTVSNKRIKKSGPCLKADIGSIFGINKIGFSHICLANNHIMDYGYEGINDTIEIIEKNNMVWVGAGYNKDSIKKHVILQGVKKIAIYNVAEVEFNIPRNNYPGCNVWNEFETYQDVEELKKEVDFIIIIYHGGVEEFRYPTPEVRNRCHNLINKGANIVITQHSHCIGSEERYKDGYCLYGQGNFSFGNIEDNFTKTGFLVEININNENKLSIKKHVLEHVDGMTIYSKNQNMSDFIERTENLINNDKYYKEYNEFCKERMLLDLDVLLGRNIYVKFLRKVLSKKLYRSFIKKSYLNNEIYTVINALRCNDHREIIINGLLQLIEDNKKI